MIAEARCSVLVGVPKGTRWRGGGTACAARGSRAAQRRVGLALGLSYDTHGRTRTGSDSDVNVSFQVFGRAHAHGSLTLVEGATGKANRAHGLIG